MLRRRTGAVPPVWVLGGIWVLLSTTQLPVRFVGLTGALERWRLRIISDFILRGRMTPWSFRKSPQALHRGSPFKVRRHREVLLVEQLEHSVAGGGFREGCDCWAGGVDDDVAFGGGVEEEMEGLGEWTDPSSLGVVPSIDLARRSRLPASSVPELTSLAVGLVKGGYDSSPVVSWDKEFALSKSSS